MRLVAIGFEALSLQSFVDGMYFNGEIFVDLTRATYRGLGLPSLGFVSFFFFPSFHAL